MISVGLQADIRRLSGVGTSTILAGTRLKETTLRRVRQKSSIMGSLFPFRCDCRVNVYGGYSLQSQALSDEISSGLNVFEARPKCFR